jgi:hypothetical protein
MPATNSTEDQLTHDLGYARARLHAAQDWLERAEQARLAADRAAREANRVLDLDDDSLESAAIDVAALAASAGLYAAQVVHRKASEECTEWQQRVFQLDEALDIKRGGAGYEL